MRYYINNGAYIGTIGEIVGAEEITESEFQAEMSRINAEKTYEPEPTPEERLESVEKRTSDLESNSAEIQEALDMLLYGVTE